MEMKNRNKTHVSSMTNTTVLTKNKFLSLRTISMQGRSQAGWYCKIWRSSLPYLLPLIVPPAFHIKASACRWFRSPPFSAPHASPCMQKRGGQAGLHGCILLSSCDSGLELGYQPLPLFTLPLFTTACCLHVAKLLPLTSVLIWQWRGHEDRSRSRLWPAPAATSWCLAKECRPRAQDAVKAT